jgi:hypothetical protein
MERAVNCFNQHLSWGNKQGWQLLGISEICIANTPIQINYSVKISVGQRPGPMEINFG